MGLGVAALAAATVEAAGETLTPWSPGMLDIHHISTGKGSCAFLICPDGTTLMVDCGDFTSPPETRKYRIGPKPDGSRRAGEWVARYVTRQMRPLGRAEIDTFILTHQHGDHCSDPRNCDAPKSKFGDYPLVGIADLAETVPVHRAIDPAYPEYNYPAPLDDEQQMNYRAFIHALVKRGGKAERVVPGSATQIRLEREPAAFPTFTVRNLVANGEVWTGMGVETRQHFPALSSLAAKEYPVENMCSVGFRLSYGEFDYFSAGDMIFDTKYGAQPWRDIETPVARVAGPVDVAVANHHGYMDATGPDFVAALRPRCFVINAWDSAHLTMGAMNNLLSRDLYPCERDIFATAMKPEDEIAIRQMAQLKSDNCHVIFRVEPGGARFEVVVTSNADESDTVVKRFGPYVCT
jgi:beta-lactamase superfamily II metal-dependent hydrolase